MRYKVKWKVDGTGPLQPETIDSFEAAQKRVRDVIAQHGSRISIEVWNEDETWQIVSSAGAEEWAKKF